MRWSKLKKLLQELFDPELRLEVFCTSQRGENGSIGRYWFVRDGETIWDEPKNVSLSLRENRPNSAASEMTRIMREYLDTPKDNLATQQFDGDEWGLVDLLKAADRRIGKRRLVSLKETAKNAAALKIISLRLRSASPLKSG